MPRVEELAVNPITHSAPSVFSVFTNRTVLIAALGYFVDIYDLVLFSIVRIASLRDLGFNQGEITSVGMQLMNVQVAGLLLGGILWGCLGDKKGRLSVLFGSIALYSVANFLNAFVTNKEFYAVLRFLAGLGLAGELGAAVTLVSESLPKQSRGYATSFVATLGITGAIFAGLTAEFLNWRLAYAFGGVLGFMLLLGRVSLRDSAMFKEVQAGSAPRGQFFMLFNTRERLRKYLAVIAMGLPCWFVLGIVLAFGPEITTELGIAGTLIVGTAVMFQYAGAALGDFVSGFLSQYLRSRNRAVLIYLLATAGVVAAFFSLTGLSPSSYYALYFCLGLATGYWALFVTMAAEQFGTNLRATAASTAPNFVRGAVIPMTMAIQYLKPNLGLVPAVGLVGVVICGFALFALANLRETFDTDLRFIEE